MAESAKHLELVRRIVAYLRCRYTGLASVAAIADLPGAIGCDKPPFIGSYRPDVYAVDAPLTITIVGEAKTQQDLETDHTKNQLSVFIQFLRSQPQGLLVIAVPWQARARAQSLVRLLVQQEDSPSRFTVIVLDDLTEVTSVD